MKDSSRSNLQIFDINIPTVWPAGGSKRVFNSPCSFWRYNRKLFHPLDRNHFVLDEAAHIYGPEHDSVQRQPI